MTEINPLHLFKEGINIIVNSWPALDLALENDADTNGELKRSNLCDGLIEYFIEENGKLEEEDLYVFFDAFFEDVFEIGVDDGSIEVKSDLIMKLWRDILQNGAESSILLKLKRDYEQRMLQCGTVKPKVQSTVRDDSVEAEDEENEGNIGPENNLQQSAMDVDIVPQVPIANKNEPDEDGWITVKSKKKRNPK